MPGEVSGAAAAGFGVGAQGEFIEEGEEGPMDMDLGEVGDVMGVALGAYWSGS